MPETPRLTNPSTSDTCESRSSSRNGPRQMIVAPVSLPARSAPARMLCQNVCVVPFGITAMVRAADDEDVEFAGAADFSPLHEASNTTRSISIRFIYGFL